MRKLCSSVRSNGSKEHSINLPQFLVNQSEELKKDELIDDDIEIIPSNILQDDFVQININECNEQSNMVSPLSLSSSSSSIFSFQVLGQ